MTLEKRTRIYIWLCYFLSMSSGMQQAGQQFILLDMREAFGITNALMAAITSVQLISSIVMSLVLSGIMDRVDYRKLLAVGAGLNVAGLFLCGISSGPVMTAGAMILSSFGGSIVMALPYLIFASLDAKHVTKHVNIQQGLLSFGAAAFPLLLALLMNRLGFVWRWSYYITGAFTGAAAILLLAINPGKEIETVAHEMPKAERDRMRIQTGYGILFTATFLCISGTLALYMAMEAGVLNYAKQYFQVGVGDVLAASLAIPIIRFTMTISRLFGTKVIKNRVTMGIGSLMVSGVAVVLMAVFPVKALPLILCGVFGLISGPAWPTVFSMGLELDTGASGRVSNLMMLLNSAGMHLGNFIVGFLADNTTVQHSFYLSGAFGILGAGLFWFAIKAYRKAGFVPEGAEWERAQTAHEHMPPQEGSERT